jgi:hypothetical protein
VNPLGQLANFTLSGSTLAAYSPFAAVYEALDGSSDAQLYGLTLADSNDSSPPAAVQIGSLSLPQASETVCYGQSHVGQTNLLDPTTAFFIIQYASTTGSCNVPTTVLMNWKDGSGTAPTPVSALTGNTLSSFYADLYTFPGGALYAEVLKTGLDLNVYTTTGTTNGTPNFSAPMTSLVTTGLESVEHHPVSLNRSGQAMSTVLFSNVLAGGAYTLYRTDTSGKAGSVYAPTVAAGTTHALQVAPTVVDNTYIYFIDITYTTLAGGEPGPPITYDFYKEPLDGSSAPVQIGTAVEPTAGGTGPFPYGITFSMIDSDGTYLILGSTNLTTSPPTFGLYTLSVSGSSSQSPFPVLIYNDPGAIAFVAFLDYGSDHLFVNEVSSTVVNKVPTTTTTSLAFTPSSSLTPLLGPSVNTSFMAWAPGIEGGPTSNTVLQFQNLPADGTQGGATLFNISTATLTTTAQFTQNNTASFFSVISQNNVFLYPVSNTIGIGYSTGPTGNVGLAVDVSKNQINTIAVLNTNVSPF